MNDSRHTRLCRPQSFSRSLSALYVVLKRFEDSADDLCAVVNAAVNSKRPPQSISVNGLRAATLRMVGSAHGAERATKMQLSDEETVLDGQQDAGRMAQEGADELESRMSDAIIGNTKGRQPCTATT